MGISDLHLGVVFTACVLEVEGGAGIVIGNEGSGVSKLVRKNCDFTVSIPVRGEIESLNASVAAGVLAYEVVRARTM